MLGSWPLAERFTLVLRSIIHPFLCTTLDAFVTSMIASMELPLRRTLQRSYRYCAKKMEYKQ
jgi:hypothetical protein